MIRHGIEITTEEDYDGTWMTFFTNAPGNFTELCNAGPLKGAVSEEAAIKAGIEFVNARQWQRVGEEEIFNLNVRLQFNNKWGYGIWVGNSPHINDSGFDTRDEAITAVRIRAKKEYADLVRSMEPNRERH